MKFSEFTLQENDLEETKKEDPGDHRGIKNVQSAEEQLQAIYKMNDVEKEISTADSLVYIRHTINTKDEFYAKEREYNDHIGPMLEEEMQKYNKVLLESPFRKELEEKLGKVLFINLELSMKGFSPGDYRTVTGRKHAADTVPVTTCQCTDWISTEKMQTFSVRTLHAEPGQKVRKAAYEASGNFSMNIR